MGKIYLFVLLTIGLMAAFAASGPSSPPAAASATLESADAGRKRPDSSASTYAQSADAPGLVLERSGDGHFYADVEVNGVPIRMLVDTGASAVALSAEDSRRAGVATSIGMDQVIGEGASGAVHGDIVTVERIRFGGVEQSEVSAAVLKSGSTSLLGQSFLRDFDSVEISGDRMHLR